MSRTASRRPGRQVHRQRVKRNRPLTVGLMIGGVILVLMVGLLVVRLSTPAVPGEERIANQGAAHISDPNASHVPYNSNPPTSGVHVGGSTAPWGVLGQPVADESSVHNLEHGGVIIHYRQGLEQAIVDQLTALTGQLQRRNQCVALIPRPAEKLDVPIAITAWNYLLELQSFEADTLTKFFEAHVGRGPEAVCRRS
jgi:hypothetical protein